MSHYINDQCFDTLIDFYEDAEFDDEKVDNDIKQALEEAHGL